MNSLFEQIPKFTNVMKSRKGFLTVEEVLETIGIDGLDALDIEMELEAVEVERIVEIEFGNYNYRRIL